ncbi:pitrilysin family protein [uncultured Muribaculum sp.]|uniref:M16 family metallopeptidase n=1 Tax=uncultured Muribaculum sp. TaxID=1918613 RepID=UPI00262FCEB6|nr:M16 family metallopeptidase [uncultured Muribaculum sp.]
MNIRKLLIQAAIAFGLLPASAFTAVTDTTVRVGTLPNGLTYYIRHNEVPKGCADFFLARGIGSVMERDNERGLAHFLEHMCFNGTEHFPGNSLISYLETLGVKFGKNLNAYTSTDETVYNICKVPVTRRTALDSCLLILRDWSCALTLSDKEIDAERGVIVNEWRHRNSSANRMLEKALPDLYPGSIYGERMPIGKMEVVENFKPSTLRGFYRRWHSPENEAIIVVGDIDTDTVEARIRSMFTPIKASKGAKKTVLPEVPMNENLIVSCQTDPEQPVHMVQLHFRHDAPRCATESEEIRASLLTDLLLNMLVNRFDELESDPDCAFHHLGVADRKYLMSRGARSLMIRGLCQPGREVESLSAWYREIKRAVDFGFTTSELDHAKAQLAETLDSEQRKASRKSNSDYAREYVRHYLDGGMLSSTERRIAGITAMMTAITTDEMTAALRTIAAPSGRGVVILSYMPEDGNGFGEADMRDAFHAVNEMTLTPYVDRVVDGPLLETEPVRGSIVSTDSLGRFDAIRYTLSNGIRVIARRSGTTPGQVLVRAVSPGGLSMQYADSIVPSLKMLEEVIPISSYGRFTANDLKRRLTGRNLKVAVEIKEIEEKVEAATDTSNLADALRLMYLRMTDIRPDRKAYASMVKTRSAQLRNMMRNAIQIMGDSIHRNVYSHQPLGAKTVAETVEAADYDLMLDIYHDRFADCSDFTYYITGDFAPDTLTDLLERYVASLPGAGRVEQAREIGYRYTPGDNEVRFTAQMSTPQSVVYTFRHAPATYTMDNIVAARAMGQIYKSRLLAELREKRGWTYTINSHASIAPDINGIDGPTFLMPAYIKVPEGKEDETAAIVDKILADIAANGVTDEELGKVRETALRDISESADDNAYWLDVLKLYDRYGLDYHSEFVPAFKVLTPAAVRDFAAHTVLPSSRMRIIMTPAASD